MSYQEELTNQIRTVLVGQKIKDVIWLEEDGSLMIIFEGGGSASFWACNNSLIYEIHKTVDMRGEL